MEELNRERFEQMDSYIKELERANSDLSTEILRLTIKFNAMRIAKEMVVERAVLEGFKISDSNYNADDVFLCLTDDAIMKSLRESGYLAHAVSKVEEAYKKPLVKFTPESVSTELKPEHLSICSWSSRVKSGFDTSPDSGIMITHLPTGIVATADSERSQHQNKVIAIEELKGKIDTWLKSFQK